MSRWPEVRLGDVLTQRKEFFEIDDFVRYKRCRVQTRAQGIILRDEALGYDIRTKRQQACRTGEFLVAEIDAKVGGFGIVPPELEGAIVSSHYFLYEVDKTQLSKRYLHWYIQTADFQGQVTAQGSTNYAAIRPDDVYTYTIPLPPLAEQERIVAWIESVAGRLEEAQRLRGEMKEERTMVLYSTAFGRRDLLTETSLRDVLTLRSPDVRVDPDTAYHFAGVYSFGRGVFASGTKRGSDFAYPVLTRIAVGNFIYPKLMAWEGAFGAVPTECDGLVVSPEFPVFELNQNRALPEILDLYFRSPIILPEIEAASTGTNARRRRLNPQDFLNLHIPLPSIEHQYQIRAMSQRITTASSLANDSSRLASHVIAGVLEQSFKG